MSVAVCLKRSLAEEFAGARLGDPRRTERLCGIAERVAVDPSASFPDAFGSPAELEGFYRFLRNDAIGWADVLRPHVEATCRRAEAVQECLAVHDTTEFTFSGQRDGLGRTSSTAQGFFAHATLLVGTDPARTPLGIAGLEQYARSGRHGRRRVRQRRNDPGSEGLRWLRGAEKVESLSRQRFSCIHVADREGDTFPFLSGLLDMGARFVIRVAQDRSIEDDTGELMRLHEQVLDMSPRASFEIEVSGRAKGLNPKMARRYPSRNARVARVSVAAVRVTLPVPNGRLKAEPIELNMVRVWETAAPLGEPAVEWILWTTEPVGTVAEIRKVVDHYRGRWVIEEYFKALKSGCQFERRQLESFNTLSMALAIFVPVAWRLLLARSVARNRPTSAAREILSPPQLRYLENKYRRPLHTAREALLAIARLGGHLTQNGEPGWQTIGRGYEKLLAVEDAVCTLTGTGTFDQS